MRQFEAAAAAYRQRVCVAVENATVLNNLGVAERELADVHEAIAAFRRCLAIRPDFHIADCNLGMRFAYSGQIEEAVDAYRRAVEICLDYLISHSNLAYAAHFIRMMGRSRHPAGKPAPGCGPCSRPPSRVAPAHERSRPQSAP